MSRVVAVLMITVAATVLLGGCIERPSAPTLPMASPTSVVTPVQPAPTQPIRILMVIAPEGFRDDELFVPKEIFEEHGAEVKIASITTKPAKGMLGAVVEPDVMISDVSVESFDVVVVIGGVGSKEYLWDDFTLRTLVKDAYDAGKVVAAICLSPVVLARAGVLEGKEATVFPEPEAVEELERGGAIYADESIVVADNIVTARDPESAEDFALAIWAVLQG
ncbi:DJ-1/PfpI family protein [Candidatus Alkanophaga liquidiphilum]|nr:Protein/nucleotide deglycase [Candidatus Alkanophaga liquidiphilum]